MLSPSNDHQRFELFSPIDLPRASGFLWNRKMMIQVNCRGFAVAQYMQPEPAKYAYAPNLEARTFMQPEQPYYSHHPGRFFYIKDESTGDLFSAPYEPVKAPLDTFVFSVGKNNIRWQALRNDIQVNIELSLTEQDIVELWSLEVKNTGDQTKNFSIFPYFPFGYMSWMNQSAAYDPDLGGVVAQCVTPYQKVEDYFKHLEFKDLSYFLHDRKPSAFETSRERFEGEGGLHNPSAIKGSQLDNGDALYETPIAALQYKVELQPGQSEKFRFLFGPAKDAREIKEVREKYFSDESFQKAKQEYASYVAQGKGAINIQTPDEQLNNFVNHWLPRQVFYHGDVNRLSTDPQTRNYIQDNMGMTYIDPKVTRNAFLHALSQQENDGAIPDGILLTREAELKYINQVPHTDHCVWFPVCLKAYLDETNDYEILNAEVNEWQGDGSATVFSRISNAMQWLLKTRDSRGLNYIAQGDWCDPMNMVGYKGKGVSKALIIRSTLSYGTENGSAVELPMIT